MRDALVCGLTILRVEWRPASDHGHRSDDRFSSYWEGTDMEEAKRKARECYALQWREVQIVVTGWEVA